MFPDTRKVNKESMNYTVVINVGVWLLALVYYFVWGTDFTAVPNLILIQMTMLFLVQNLKFLQSMKKRSKCLSLGYDERYRSGL